MANFLGFKQVTKAEYTSSGYTAEDRKYYMWLVRDTDAGTAEIYFGNRLYAEVNGNDALLSKQIESIVGALGASLNEQGEFVNFLPIDEDEILGKENIKTVSDALKALSLAIKDAQASINGVKQDVVKAQETADSAITKADEAKSEIDKVNKDLSGKIDAIVEQVSGLTEDAVSKDDFQAEIDRLKTDISSLATKEALEAEKTERESADTKAGERIKSLEDKSTQIVTNYKEASELTGLTPGQIVYANESYTDTDDSGKTYGSGAYLVISVTPEGVPSFSKIESTTTGGQTPTDLINEINSKVDAVDKRVATNEKSIETINNTISELHTISGDDVEE